MKNFKVPKCGRISRSLGSLIGTQEKGKPEVELQCSLKDYLGRHF